MADDSLPKPDITALGTGAITVRFPVEPSKGLSRHLSYLAEKARGLPRVIDAVPGYRTLLIEVEDGHGAEVAEALKEPRDLGRSSPSRSLGLAVEYDGPDLDWAADRLGLEVPELVRIHASIEYQVVALASPGFIYLSPTPIQLTLPRLDTPRYAVEPGSIGIGGRQTGIYSSQRPGGWRLIGRLKALPEISPGDSIRFLPTS